MIRLWQPQHLPMCTRFVPCNVHIRASSNLRRQTHTRQQKKIPSIVVCLWASKMWDDVSVSAFKSRHFYSFLHGLICIFTIFTISLAFFGVISYCWHTSESQFNSEHNSNDCLLAVTGWNKMKKKIVHCISVCSRALRRNHYTCCLISIPETGTSQWK